MLPLSVLIFSISLLISNSLAYRNERKVQFKIDGQYYNFNFVPSNRNVYNHSNPVWLAKSVPGSNPNYNYQKVENSGQLINGYFYTDNDKQAVVYAHYDQINRKLLYDGIFGEGDESHIIKSLEHHSRKKRSLNGHYQTTRVNQDNIPRLNSYPISGRMYSKLMKVPLETPLTTFYPKVLTIVDNHLFRKLGNDLAATIQYVTTFWNAVDQKFIDLKSPKVQFILTGIIVVEDETALNYIYQSRLKSDVSEGNSDKADANLMLEKSRLYFHHNFSSDIKDFNNYDVAVTLTGLNTGAIGGSTHIGKICDYWYNVAIISDDGKFYGVRKTAHEMAHLMNVGHDSVMENDRCYHLAADGSVSMMSPFMDGSRKAYWSDCTKKYLNNFSKVKAAQCLEARERTRYYPGDYK